MFVKRTFSYNFSLLANLILFSLLAGCNTTPSLVHTTNTPHWQATGRLAIVKNNEGNAASFIWEQHGDYFRIKLFGPFGARAMFLSGNRQGVEMQTHDGNVIRAASCEELLQKQLGWHVPISGLEFDPPKKLLRLQQPGWQIEYEQYPKLFLRHGDLHIKMVVTSWKQL